MDLSAKSTTKKANEGAFLHLRDPRTDTPLLDEKTGEAVGLTLLGCDSSLYRKLAHEVQNARLERMRVARGKIKGLRADVTDEENRELIAKMCVRVHHIECDGAALSSTFDDMMLLFDRLPWVYDQATEFVEDRTNHLGN
jgi:hypothetical protein